MKTKNILLAPFRLMGALLDRLISALFAVLFAQIPQFMLLYITRLDARVNELALIVEQYGNIARETGRTLELYIRHLQNSSDQAVSKTGDLMYKNMDRLDDLRSALFELQSASPASKFFVFLANIDLGIVRNTWKNFSAGLPFTMAGAVYAVIGLFSGMAVFFLVRQLFRAVSNRIFKQKDEDSSAVRYR